MAGNQGFEPWNSNPRKYLNMDCWLVSDGVMNQKWLLSYLKDSSLKFHTPISLVLVSQRPKRAPRRPYTEHHRHTHPYHLQHAESYHMRPYRSYREN